MDALTHLMVVILQQHIHRSNHHAVHLKHIQVLLVNYTSIKLQNHLLLLILWLAAGSGLSWVVLLGSAAPGIVVGWSCGLPHVGAPGSRG